MPQDPVAEGDLGAQLRGVIVRLSRQLNASATGEGLTPSQASALGVIAFRGPLDLPELTAVEGLNPTMVSRIVRKLDEEGLIRRVPKAHDLRSASLEVTERGREVNEHVRQRRARVVSECLERLPLDGRAAIVAALPALQQLAEELIRERS